MLTDPPLLNSPFIITSQLGTTATLLNSPKPTNLTRSEPYDLRVRDNKQLKRFVVNIL
jgi:hypothetical protein